MVASNIQGIRDAVIDGKTGWLVGEGDVNGFLEKITGMRLERDEIRKVVNSTFDWKRIYNRYHDFFVEIKVLLIYQMGPLFAATR